MGELFVNFKCYEGISSPMIESHNDLHVKVSKKTVTGNWYSIFIGNRTSKGIDGILFSSVNATTIYANSCPDQVININLVQQYACRIEYYKWSSVSSSGYLKSM